MDVEPDGMAQKAADMTGMLDRRVKGDLKRFKGFIEERADATGGWRGRIRPEDADAGSGAPMGSPDKGPDTMREAPGPVETPGPRGPARGTQSWSLPPDDPDMR
jgi:hypothetical protein